MIQAGVVLLVAYGGAFVRFRATRDMLDLPALVSAITGTLFAPPVFGMVRDDDELFQPGADAALSRVLLVVLATLVVFHVAVWAFNRRSEDSGPGSVAPVAPPPVPLLEARWVVWALCGGAIGSAVVLQVGADAIIGRAAEPLALKSTDQLPPWYFFAQGGLCLSHLAFWLALASALASGRRLISWPVVLTGALAIALAATQGRMMIVNLVIPVALLIHYHRRRFTVSMMVGATVLALSYFLVWDAYREGRAGQRPSGLGLSPAGVWKGITNNLDYTDSFVLLVLADHRLELGRTYLAPATKPVPRSVWAGKPFGGNAQLTEVIFPGLLANGFSRAASAVTEGYLNFGIVGPPFVFLALGFACAALVRWHERRPGRPDATVWFAIWFLGILTLVRTDAQIATTFLGYYLLPLVAIVFVLRRASRVRPHVPPRPSLRSTRGQRAATGRPPRRARRSSA